MLPDSLLRAFFIVSSPNLPKLHCKGRLQETLPLSIGHCVAVRININKSRTNIKLFEIVMTLPAALRLREAVREKQRLRLNFEITRQFINRLR